MTKRPHLAVVVFGLSFYHSNAFVPRHSIQPTTTQSIATTTRVACISQRPLEEILLELEARDIHFSPTATRAELEYLLSKRVRTPVIGRTESLQQNDVVESKEDPRPPMRKRPTTSSRRKRLQRKVPEMDESLNDRGNRRRRRQRRVRQQAPADILFRVVNKTTRTVTQLLPEQVVDVSSKATRIAGRKTQQLFQELVDMTYGDPPYHPRYNSQDVRRRKEFEDNAADKYSQSEAEDNPLKQERRRKAQKAEEQLVNDVSPMPRLQVETAAHFGNCTEVYPDEIKVVPIREILSELDIRNIRYSPQATRAELEEFLEAAFRDETQQQQQTSVESFDIEDIIAPHLTNQSHTMEQPSEKRILAKASKVASKKIKAVPKTISDTVRTKARNTYRKAQRRVSSLFQDQPSPGDTAPIVVDAVVEDFSKIDWEDDVIDVEPTYRGTWSTIGRTRTTTSKSHDRPNRSERTTVAKARLRNKNLRDSGRDTRRWETRGSPQQSQRSVTSRSTPRLNPATVEHGAQQAGTRRSSTDRRIYSPYSHNADTYVDSLDRLGTFIANSVDSFLWGSDQERVTNQSRDRRHEPSRQRKSGHWKDRMEEQFDYLLGIHQDGKYYNRWVNDEGENINDIEGTDAVSYARGKASHKGTKRRNDKKPIWEEEDSLLSILFGTDKDARKRSETFFRSPSIFASGSLIKVLRTLFRSASLVAGGVCRWASVRGSLPQPIVVVGVAAAALSSRAGSRVRNVVLVLLTIRAAGELLHGYMYEDTDFWDPRDDDDTST